MHTVTGLGTAFVYSNHKLLSSFTFESKKCFEKAVFSHAPEGSGHFRLADVRVQSRLSAHVSQG